MGGMELDQYAGYDIFLQRHWWEVYTPGGLLVASGRGGLKEARNWILQQLVQLAHELAEQTPAHH